MKKLLLKYNPRIGSDKLPILEDLSKKYQLKIESVEEDCQTKIKLKVISISGDPEQLAKLDRELVRHASIRRKQIY